MSWNIEGVHRGFPSLVSLTSTAKPSLIFLSEPQDFACNINLFMAQLPMYKFFLNSKDRHLPDLPMDTLRAKGGTMAMWASHLDPYVTVLPSASSAVLPLILAIPGFATTAHIGIYLLTRGLEQEWTIVIGI